MILFLAKGFNLRSFSPHIPLVSLNLEQFINLSLTFTILILLKIKANCVFGFVLFFLEFKWFLFLYSLNLPNQVLLITRVLGSLLSGSVPDLPLEQRCVEVVQHVEGRRGETARNDSNPHPISRNPGNFPYPLRERRRKKGFSLFLIIFLAAKHQGIKPNCSVIFREHGKGPFLFLKQNGLETPSFP